MKPMAAATSSRLALERSIAGARRLSSSEVAAALRLWTSSPICSACAISGFTSIGPVSMSVVRASVRSTPPSISADR